MTDDQQTRRRLSLVADESETIDLSAYKLKTANHCSAVQALAYAANGTTVVQVGAAEVFAATAAGGFTVWSFTGAEAAGSVCSFVIELTNGGSQTQVWPAAVDWPSGTAPTLTAAGKDVLVFWTSNGGAAWSGIMAAKDVR